MTDPILAVLATAPVAHVVTLETGTAFPPMPDPPSGYVIRISVETVAGVGR